MLRVQIESPYAGDVEANTAYARACLLDSLRRGEAPFASHLLYTQVLDDLRPEDRNLGMDAGFAYLLRADLVAFYVDRGMSRGMLAALKAVKILPERPHVFRSLRPVGGLK